MALSLSDIPSNADLALLLRQLHMRLEAEKKTGSADFRQAQGLEESLAENQPQPSHRADAVWLLQKHNLLPR